MEAALLALVMLAFTRVHALVGDNVAAATANARTLQRFERTLHLDIELSMNRWLVGHDALITPSVIVYRLYYAVLIGVLFGSSCGTRASIATSATPSSR